MVSAGEFNSHVYMYADNQYFKNETAMAFEKVVGVFFLICLPYRPNFERPKMCTALFPHGPNYARYTRGVSVQIRAVHEFQTDFH